MSRARDLAAFVSNADGDIKFDTDTLFIDSSANRVGISTTSPQADLMIGNADGASRSMVVHTQNNGDARLRFREGSTVDSGYNEYSFGMDGGENAMTFETQGSGEVVRINSSGNVHITDNTNGPDAALHIEKTYHLNLLWHDIKFAEKTKDGVGNYDIMENPDTTNGNIKFVFEYKSKTKNIK